MAQTILIKRSNVAAKVPTNSQVVDGELALNTADGKLYTVVGQTTVGTGTIVEIGTRIGSTTAPTSPVEGQVWYDTTNNILKVYDGSAWVAVGTHASATAPSNPIEGTVWYDTTNDFAKVYNGTAWVAIGTHASTSSPTNPTEGALWYDTTNNHLNYWDGSAWQNSSGISSATAPTNPTEGQLWYDDTNDTLKVWDGSAWRPLIATPNTSAPATALEGTFWYDLTNNFAKVYNGTAWVAIASNTSATAPSSPIEGTLWYDTADNTLNVWADTNNDGTADAWVASGNYNFLEARNTVPTLRDNGTALQAGDIYYNTADSEMKVYTGVAGKLWTPIGSGGAPAGTSSASSVTGGAAGQVLYQSAANTTAFTAVGTAGQVLTSQGTGAPIWAAAAGGVPTDVGSGVGSINIGQGNGEITANGGTTSNFRCTILRGGSFTFIFSALAGTWRNISGQTVDATGQECCAFQRIA